MPLTRLQIVLLLGLPFAVAILAAAIARLVTFRHRRAAGDSSHAGVWPSRLALPLAIALGPALALIAAPLIFKDFGLTLTLPPRTAFDWHMLSPAAALVVGIAAVWLKQHHTALLVAGVGALMALCLSVQPGMSVTWDIWPAVVAPAAIYAVLDHLATMHRNPAIAVIVLLLAAATVCVDLDSSSTNLGITGFPMLAAAVGLLVAYPLFPARDFSRAVIPAFVLLWMAHLLYGHFWADVPGQRTLLLALAPVAGVLAAIPPLGWQKSLWRSLAATILIAIPLAVATIPAARELRQQVNADVRRENSIDRYCFRFLNAAAMSVRKSSALSTSRSGLFLPSGGGGV